MPPTVTHKTWAIVPAAGIGRRMQSDVPKQYLMLEGRPVLEHTVNRLLSCDHIYGLVIALKQDDPYWHDINIISEKPVIRAIGGRERSDSVLNAIEALLDHKEFDESDWVMVHDAVRPCVQQSDIDELVRVVGDNVRGGILALPVRDTMKKQHIESSPDDTQAVIDSTIERELLWHALTPQYFPLMKLKTALESACRQDIAITDESSAMEYAGFSPMLVTGHEDNIKITRPDDLRLASLFIRSQQ